MKKDYPQNGMPLLHYGNFDIDQYNSILDKITSLQNSADVEKSMFIVTMR